MLKWTIAKREQAAVGTTPARTATSSCTIQRRSIDALRERKQRRHSTRRASLCVRLDKENRGITTPTTRTDFDVKALRDVSNLTSTPRSFCEESSPAKIAPRARKKQCLDPGHLKQHTQSEGLLKIPLQDNNCRCVLPPSIAQTAYSSTLPSFQMEYSPCLREATCPGEPITKYPYQLLPHLKPFNLNNLNNINYLNSAENNKKLSHIDHVDDFLHQISFITSPEELKIKPTAKQKLLSPTNQANVTPLLKKIVDLRFSQISTGINVDKDDSTGFNDLSLDKIVNAILDTTDSENKISAKTTIATKTENVEDNQNMEIKINIRTSLNMPITDTSEISRRKRTKSITEDDSFKLKRQKCVRRRKQQNTLNNNDVPYEGNMFSTPTSTMNEVELSFRENLNDNSFNSSCISGKNYSNSKTNTEQSLVLSQQLESLRYSPWKREICCGLGTPSLEKFAKEIVFKRKRKMSRSVSDRSMTMTASSTPTKFVGGFVDIQTENNKGILHVNGKKLFTYFYKLSLTVMTFSVIYSYPFKPYKYNVTLIIKNI